MERLFLEGSRCLEDLIKSERRTVRGRTETNAELILNHLAASFLAAHVLAQRRTTVEERIRESAEASQTMKYHESSSNTRKAPCHLSYERRLLYTGLYITRSDPCFKGIKFLRGAISAFQNSRIAGSDSCPSCGKRFLLQVDKMILLIISVLFNFFQCAL